MQPDWLDHQSWYRIVAGFFIGFVVLLPPVLMSVLLYGLLLVMSKGISSLILVMIYVITVVSIVGLSTGLLGGVIAGLLYRWKPRVKLLEKFEEQTIWSRPQGRARAWILVIGLIAGLGGWFFTRSDGLILSLLNGVIALFVIVLILRHEVGSSTYLPKDNKPAEPYQYLKYSASVSAFALLLGTVGWGLFIGLLQHLPLLSHLLIFSSFTSNVPQDVPFGSLILGSALGTYAALRGGGIDCILYVTLRIFLWRSGAIPWRYARFLEEMHERILLQRVGGGYRFIHPLLQDYFASLRAQTSANAQPPPSSLQP